MKELCYTIKTEHGVHARPAGHIAGLASGFACGVRAFARNQAADAKNVLEVMGLALRHGDELRMTFDGADESAAAAGMLAFLEQNL
jgi:phosphotransferase system HPr (HPr) family protein